MFIIAYKNLAHYRHTVHRYLDAIWLASCKKKNARNSMYLFLSTQMNIPYEQTHVKYFTREQCRQAIRILRPRYIALYGKDLEFKSKERIKMLKVTRHIEFEASHLLPNYDGGCANLHGHTYKLEVTVQGPQSGLWDMVVDFKQLTSMLKEIVPDHMYLHQSGNPISEEIVSVLDKYGLKYHTFEKPTTAENMVTYFKDTINDYLHNEMKLSNEYKVSNIKLWETRDSYAELAD